MEIAVLIPVLGRPHRVEPLLASLDETTGHDCWPLFLVSPHDEEEIAAVEATGVDMLQVDWAAGGDYARKMNAGFAHTETPFVFLAADDLRFRPDWAERAIATWEATGAGVVGTNDLGNSRVISGEHATHSLVERAYGQLGTIDDPGRLLHEGYWHNFVDDELVGTAKHRGAYAAAGDSVVEHLHPNWGKSERDGTYLLAEAHFEADRLHFDRRRPSWGAWGR